MADRTGIEWADVPGWPGFRVTRDGQQISGPSGQVLKQRASRDGHVYVTARRGGKQRKLWVHRSVLLAFVGPCPDGQEARHLDGDPLNNSLENLAWGTREEQRADDRRHGVRRGRPQALDREKADAIRNLEGSASARAVAARFGVSHTAVLRIWRGEVWRG